MSKNIRGEERNEEGKKGDDICFYHCNSCFMRRPVRILIETTKKYCRKYGHMDEGLNAYCPMVYI